MFHTISYKELFPEKRRLSNFIPIYRDSHVVLQYSSEGGQALTWLGFFWSIGIGRARVIFPAGSETPSLCIQKKSNYISVIALSLKTAAIYSPTLSCSTIDVIGLNFSVRNGKRWNPNAKTTWNLGLVDVLFCCFVVLVNFSFRYPVVSLSEFNHSTTQLFNYLTTEPHHQ